MTEVGAPARPRRTAHGEPAANAAGTGMVFGAPVWAWLAGLIVLSALLRFLLATRVEAPWIMVDELIYSELAKSVASSGEFLIREQPYDRYGPLYPALISPAWRAFQSVPHAYSAAKAINALVMSLAAVPAYLLGRRVLTPPFALLGAALALAVPSMAYTGALMTENLAYPLVLTALLALVLTLERPTLLRALSLLGLCLLAFLTRAQAVALVPAASAAPLLLALVRGRISELRRFVVLYVPLVFGGLVVVAVQLGRGRAVEDVFGAYSFVGNLDYSAGRVVKWLFYHVAELDLYVGILPAAAFLLLLAGARRASARDQALLVSAAAVTVAFLVEVAMFASSLPWVRRVAERSMFYAAPLLLIALLVWIERGLPRPPRAAALAALAAAALPAALPFGELVTTDAGSDTLALVPWLRLRDHGLSPEGIRAAVLVGSVLAAVLFLRLPARYAAVLPASIILYFAFMLVGVQNHVQLAGDGARAAAADGGDPDWVDRTVGPSAHAAVLWSGEPSTLSIWETEFFNRAVGLVYDLDAPLPGNLPEEPVHVDPGGVVRDHLGRPVYGPYVLTDRSVQAAGTPVARSVAGRLTLYRVQGPVRLLGER